MKILKTLFAAALVLAVSACNWAEQEIQDRNVVLMYISCHDNGLSQYSKRQINEFKAGSDLPLTCDYRNIFLLYSHLDGQAPTLSRYSRTRSGEFLEEVIKTYPEDTRSVDAGQIRMVISDASEAYPAEHSSLILSSHASSFLPARTKAAAAPAVDDKDICTSFGPDDDLDINIQDLRSALSPFHFDFIMFDCCFMGSVELCYELKDCTDYIIGSANEVMADGMTRSSMIPFLFARGSRPDNLERACKSYMKHVAEDSGYFSSGMISLIKTSALPSLADAARAIFSAHRLEIALLNTRNVQSYRGLSNLGLYDLTDFVRHISSESELQEFSSRMDEAVLFKDSTPYFLNYQITTHSGLSSYIPKPEKMSLNNFYKTLAWNQATGLVE